MTVLLSKKTKTELLEDYNKLLTQHDELKRTAQLVSDPQSVALLTRVEAYSVDQLTQSIAQLKSSVNATLNELADKLIQEAQKFGELQKAIELAKKNLELHYHIQVAADTLDRLIQDHKTNTIALEEESADKQRGWSREQEEYEYATVLKARRAQDEFNELKAKQDRMLKEREEALKLQEQDLAQLRAQVQGFPAQLDKALNQREIEVAKRLRVEFDVQAGMTKKDGDAQKRIQEMQIENLEERIKAQNAENIALRGEVEKANKRVQELAVKIIESGARVTAKLDDAKDAKVVSASLNA